MVPEKHKGLQAKSSYFYAILTTTEKTRQLFVQVFIPEFYENTHCLSPDDNSILVLRSAVFSGQ
jgi:hypothetical protein